ncbi:Anaphase-promoting complex subunit 5 [Mortierella claussenii]|nr:Anaphase-promoting complex subunit 5 [Mortierella claussenii]
MTSRRPFARTATDISLTPPQTLGFGSEEQAATDSLTNELLNGTISNTHGLRSGPVHVVPYLTPHKVSVLILIEHYCQNGPLDAAQSLLLFLLKCIQDPSEYLHNDINKLGAQVSHETSHAIWDHLRTTLKRIRSPHHLSDFFLSKLELDAISKGGITPRRIGLEGLVLQRGEIIEDQGTIGLDPESIMGLYVRKARIEYRKLTFEHMCKFYTALETYISEIGREDQSPRLDRPTIKPEGSTVLSAFDMEKYLDVQTQQLSNLGQADIPEDLLAHVRSIQARMPSQAKTHYITCLHAQQTGDFEVAIQSLHRFFDYCMAVDDRVLYQYALLNLAMLHVRFSHYEQALIQGESMLRSLESLVKASSINLRHSLEGISGVVQLFQSRIWGAYALNGRFQEALHVIELAKARFPLKTMKATPWVQSLVQILHRQAMSANRLRDAEIWTQQLGTTLVNTSLLTLSVDSGNSKNEGSGNNGTSSRENQLDDTSRDLQLEILLQKALLGVLSEQRLSSVQLLSEGLAIVRQNQWPGTHKFTVMYLLAMAEIYTESDSAISAMPLLLTAMTLSEHNLQRPLLLLVKLRLSEVLLHLDSIQQATSLVDGLMNMVLNQGDAFVQSLAYFQRAKCLLARINKMPISETLETIRQQKLKQVMDHLNRALEGFQRIESLKDITQVQYFQVRVCHQMGQVDEIQKQLHLFRSSSQKLSSVRNKHEPSWYSYYYARDSFDGILGTRLKKATLDDSTASSKAEVSQMSTNRLAQGRASSFGGLKRVGSSQWGGLKRAPSELWRSTAASSLASTSALDPPDERDERDEQVEGLPAAQRTGNSQEGQEAEDDDMDLDDDDHHSAEGGHSAERETMGLGAPRSVSPASLDRSGTMESGQSKKRRTMQ